LASKDRPNPVAPQPVPVSAGATRHDASLLSPDDLFLFNQGNHTRLYERLGSHPRVVDGVAGTSFAVFAPNAEAISVMLQTSWFRYTRKRYGTGQRIFLMAPLHHHFEKKGWYESQVVMRFYILCVLCAVVALSTLKIR